MRVSVAFACLLLVACAHETKERPAPARAPESAPAQSSALPFPESAFSGSGGGESYAGASRPVQVGEDRYTTRRIGPRGDEGAHRYHGARIDLDVKGADLQDVFRLIADVGKVNIVVAGDVTGTITLKLARVPWDQALDVVAKAKGLTLERDGNVIIVYAH